VRTLRATPTSVELARLVAFDGVTERLYLELLAEP